MRTPDLDVPLENLTARGKPPVAREPAAAPSVRPRARRRPRRGVLLAVGAACLAVVGLVALLRGGGGPSVPLVLYTVRRGDLEITVTERGNLASQDEIKVLCEVDDIDGDGVRGTTITYIVPNGASVSEGDLLVELDASSLQERLDQQVLSTERARADAIQARVKFENQKTQNSTTTAEAKLKVDLTDLALIQYDDDEGGTFHISLQDVELQIQEAQASRLIERTNLEGVEQLHKLGYRTSGELAQARLSALKAERLLATGLSKRKELVDYQYRKMKLDLEGQLASARRSLVQVERDNEALLAQAQAALRAADQSLKKEEERLARYQEQVQKCRIHAPADGMVAYFVNPSPWRREEIRVGAQVGTKQPIMTLPNLTTMQVRTAVHESVLDQVRPDLKATVRVDSFPDRTYPGSVLSVAVLPDQGSWMGSDTKVYETIIAIDEEVSQLKPGMTAVVEIHVDRLSAVLSVPVQAVVQEGQESWVYVALRGRATKRPVTLGRTNEKLVEVREGIVESEQVVLNALALVEVRERGPDADTAPPAGPGEAEEAKEASPARSAKPASGADDDGGSQPEAVESARRDAGRRDAGRREAVRRDNGRREGLPSQPDGAEPRRPASGPAGGAQGEGRRGA